VPLKKVHKGQVTYSDSDRPGYLVLIIPCRGMLMDLVT
jgi:hypothetical protein